MGNYTRITADAFSRLQHGAGIVCSAFDPDSSEPPADEAILFSTTGTVSFSAVPTDNDDGEDINGCPKNTKELRKRQYTEVKLSGTFLDFDPDTIALAIGAADVSGGKVTPRRKLAASDFRDIWWVGDYGEDDTGYVAIHVKNALSTAGFDASFNEDEKGQGKFEFTGHYSLDAQDEEPYEIIVRKKAAE